MRKERKRRMLKGKRMGPENRRIVEEEKREDENWLKGSGRGERRGMNAEEKRRIRKSYSLVKYCLCLFMCFILRCMLSFARPSLVMFLFLRYAFSFFFLFFIVYIFNFKYFVRGHLRIKLMAIFFIPVSL